MMPEPLHFIPLIQKTWNIKAIYTGMQFSNRTLLVVDENNIIHGIVTFDDVIRIMEDAASEDIFTMVGTPEIDPFAKKARNKIIARAPWLVITFIGGLISAFILSHF